ncbi:hypothetical protein VAE151_520442 [Vibrio aestuarianus]|uniref:Uncharacterized protein n=1 Tax=Vibrio aestuarianus TaxID=28171 RepID=A0ABM9FNL3_9VIBR|nr:hypothetical protein VAE308_1010443 [Vibrio aestuarianus]CAH8188198.1 hypothetical protein VAE032_240444 [Vibrio aestuarianus]CAH8188326.1 hypothetical protein VAE055_340444 [Vibrio aestuarianus]CAH8188509.1 hypothetical protein VAE128_440445 [Vibrio aestuarianus]CAH8188654.1 hypothetical protein VAE130_550448 [Vibrio aestuarianus]
MLSFSMAHNKNLHYSFLVIIMLAVYAALFSIISGDLAKTSTLLTVY